MKSSQTEWISRLKKAVGEVRTLRTEVDKFMTAPPSKTKRVPFFGECQVVCAAADMSLQERPYVNGSEDIYIERLGCIVSGGASGATLVGDWGQLMANESGYAVNDLTDVTEDFRVFDFLWNYRLASTQAYYASTANSLALLSRHSLGNLQRARVLEFDTPQVLKAGDTISFQVKPILNRIPNPSSFAVFTVTMCMWGYRTGVMAL